MISMALRGAVVEVSARKKNKRSSPARHEAVCSNKSEAVAGIIIGENAETTS